jgi:hypothetical protein
MSMQFSGCEALYEICALFQYNKSVLVSAQFVSDKAWQRLAVLVRSCRAGNA